MNRWKHFNPMTGILGRGLQRHGNYFLMLFVLGLAGCQSEPDPSHSPSVQTASVMEVAHPGPDTAGLQQRVTLLEAEMDSLKASFTYQQFNLPVPSYYHKNWWGRYYIHGNALMAGVDSAGIFFLIDSYNCSLPRDHEVEEKGIMGLGSCDSARSRLELRMKDTTVVLRMRPGLPEKLWPQRKPPIHRDMWIGTGHFCTDYYPLPDNPDLIALLADPGLKQFKFYRYCNGRGHGDIGIAGKRDLAGIQDCARLSLQIKELAQLKAQQKAAPL
jgi:hypothetical protein